MEQIYNNITFTTTDEDPQNGDHVITEEYGIWVFKDEGGGTAPLPFWANKNACKKITAINGKDITEISKSRLEDLFLM